MQKRGWLLAVLLILPLVSAQDFISRSDIPASVPFTEVVATLAKPGVVQIEAILEISGSVPPLSFEDGKIVELGPPTKKVTSIRSTGSGFVVTPDGYVVTNAHIFNSKDMLFEFIDKTLDAQKVPAELKQTVGEYLEKKVTIDVKPLSVLVLQPISGPSGFMFARIPAEVKKIGEEQPGKDVAILKVSMENMPTVSLTTESPPAGTEIITVGFPEAAQMGVAPNEATITSGIISAYKTTDTGWKAIQIDADISSGNSGGPALDSNGRVIGIATFGSTGAAAGYNWLVPTDIVIEFLNELNVKPSRGVLDQLYEQGLVAYWNGKYQTAINNFRLALELMPNHPIIPELVFRSRLKLEEAGYSAEKWKTAFFIFGAAVLIALIFLFFFFWREEKEIKMLEKRRR